MKNLKIMYKTSNYDPSEFPTYINEVIESKLSKMGNELNNYHFYTLTIEKHINRTNYHSFDLEIMQEISRKFTNGLSTLGSITNRKFFSNHFIGGLRITTVHQSTSEDFPIVSLNFELFSKQDNLDICIKNQLTTRIKMVDHSLIPRFEYHGKFSNDILQGSIPDLTKVDFMSEPIKKLNNRTIQQIFKNNFQRPRYYGHLYRLK